MGCYAHSYDKKIEFDYNFLPNFDKDIYDKLMNSTDEEDHWIAYDYLHMKVTKYVTNRDSNHVVSPCLEYTTFQTEDAPYIAFRLRNWPKFQIRSFEDIKYIQQYLLEGKSGEYYDYKGLSVALTSDFESDVWKHFEKYLKNLYKQYPNLVIDFA